MPVWSEKILNDLYTTQKKSATEIAALFCCSEHKVYYWLKQYKILRRTISEAVYCKHNPNGDPFIFRAPKSKNEAVLYGLGLGLYWGEGTKSNKNSVRLGNTDPALIAAFIDFLETFFAVERKQLRFGLQLFSDMNPIEAGNYWARKLRVKNTQFYKTICTGAQSIGTYREKTKHGVLTVYFNNTKLRDKLCLMIEEISKIY